MEKLLNPIQAATLLQIHPKTVKKLAARGEIPALRFGKLWRFQESALAQWVAEQLRCAGHPCSRGETP